MKKSVKNIEQPKPAPVPGVIDQNAETLAREITWFVNVVNKKLLDFFPAEKLYLSADKEKSEVIVNSDDITPAITDVPIPDLSNDHSVYSDFVSYYKLNPDERLLLILALMPYVQPHLLDAFFSVNKATGRGYTEFGGVKGSRHGGFIPTIETALFLLGGNDLSYRFKLYRIFEPDHVFFAHNILQLDQGSTTEPFYCSIINVTDEYVDFFTTGNLRKPQFSPDFPAKRLTTGMEWSDLIVDEYTMQQLDEIRIWLQYGQTLQTDWGMSKKIKPGFKALFHGSPGTGKTLTAMLLGKLFNLDVYRIDLSMVVSKYIGETEKNLEKVFKKAENKKWILFFDEADALFSKRTSISDSNDKYANQEVAYLLQRLEDYPGLVILASNMRNNVDEAFTRRLNSIIHFQKPQGRERLRIWSAGFSTECIPPDSDHLQQIAHQHELSGGSIMNVIQYASLMALNRSDKKIEVDDIILGIKKEFKKEGKTM
ncbi:ATP-binding protein [Mucilaginibacter sp. OK098]|uniref:ATP-binding protein n=1 Tax=Mucilaginibacter sp. OK098 TaxID=1855297 RepID=UPI000914A978|nr:ATP-binding protein [Mucilaginibacter sp. OK098]SHN27391.1 ATPase family associated with various cellular activities (AAA) [Mucilaginibacter sp. OK098]